MEFVAAIKVEVAVVAATDSRGNMSTIKMFEICGQSVYSVLCVLFKNI